MLRDNGINPDNYIGLPYNGGVRYYREDVFDDLPDQRWAQLMTQAVPYEGATMMSEEMFLADNHKRRFQRRQFRMDKKAARQQARADRQAKRQEQKTIRSQTRSQNLDKLAPAIAGVGGALTKSGIFGDQTGGTISFGTGQGIQGEGQIGIGRDANFITTDSIIPNVPNYIVLAGAGLGAYLLLKK